MKTNEIFLILDIDETKDVDLIKTAYLMKLKTVNPEYDPEGFKKLREAYEAANEFCSNGEENIPAEAFKRTPVDLWIQKAEDIYKNLNTRRDVDKWSELLRDDVCYSLEYSLEVKDRMLRFLNEHIRLPRKVWEYINDYYEFDKNREEFYELCPKHFLDFVISQAQNREILPYDKFEGDLEADYDSFINYYYDLVEAFFENDTTQIRELIGHMEKTKIQHPYFTALKAVTEDNWDVAVPIYKDLHAEFEDHYLTNRNLAHYYFLQGEYKEAREYCLEALRVSSDDFMVEELIKTNKELLNIYMAKGKSELTTEEFLEVGWIYLQNSNIDQGIEHLDSKNIEDIETLIDQAEFESLYAKMYFEQDSYHKASEAALREKEALEGIVFSDSDENQNKDDIEKKVKKRIQANLSLLARIYEFIGDETAEEDEKKRAYELALGYADSMDEERSKESQNILLKANIYSSLKEYEKTVEQCDLAIEVDQDFFPAYMVKQEACSKLWDGQGVIDCFYGAKRIFAGYAKMYKLAMDVFLGMEQLEDAEDIYTQAVEAEIEDAELEINHLKLLKKQDKHAEALEKARLLPDKFTDESEEVRARLYEELALCLNNAQKLEEALEFAEKACKIHLSGRAVWIKADIILDMEKYEEALKFFEICCEMDTVYENWTLMSQRKGYCYECMGDVKKAIFYFKEAYERDNENESALIAVITTYYGQFDNDGFTAAEKEDARRYVEIASSKELDYGDNVSAGDLCYSMGENLLAIEFYKKAVEITPEWWSAYNDIGLAYLRQNMPDEAEKSFLESIKYVEDRILIPYRNILLIYKKRDDYSKIIEICKYIIENGTRLKKQDPMDDNDWGWYIRFGKKGLLNCYRNMKDYEKALEYLSEVYSPNEADYYCFKSDILCDMGDKNEALKVLLDYYKKIKGIFSKDKDKLPKICCRLGDLYYFHMDDELESELFYQRSVSAVKDDLSQMCDPYRALLKLYFFAGNIKDAKYSKKMFFKYLDISDDEEELERYISVVSKSTGRLTDIVYAYICAGETELAEKYATILTESNGRLCGQCVYNECWEHLQGLGMICESKGDKKTALSYYEKVLKIEPEEELTLSRVATMKNK